MLGLTARVRLQVHAVQCDVRDPQAVSRCVDELEKLTGLPDVKKQN